MHKGRRTVAAPLPFAAKSPDNHAGYTRFQDLNPLRQPDMRWPGTARTRATVLAMAATSGSRRFDGHKAAIVVDTGSQLITAAEVHLVAALDILAIS